MLQKFKVLISTLGIIALLLTTFSAVSFADRGEREYRGDRNNGRYDNRFDNRDSRSRGDRYDRDDRDDDRDDDDGVTAPTPSPLPPVVEPTPEPTPPVVVEPTPEPTPPVVEPTPEPTPPVVVEPTPEPTPPVVEPTPPAIDGSAKYDQYCSGCHGQANKGKNIPSSHLNDYRASGIPQADRDAINAL